MTDKLISEMAGEFCRWQLPEKVYADMHRPLRGGGLLTHAEALQMFTEIVGPKIAALEAELARLREPVAWQSIETAPRDGTHILVVCADDDESEIEITNWYSISGFDFNHVKDDLYRRVERSECAGWNGNGHRATHWMPLPEPPK